MIDQNKRTKLPTDRNGSLGPGAWVRGLGHGAWVGAWGMEPGASVLGPPSWSLGPWASVLGPRSWGLGLVRPTFIQCPAPGPTYWSQSQ